MSNVGVFCLVVKFLAFRARVGRHYGMGGPNDRDEGEVSGFVVGGRGER